MQTYKSQRLEYIDLAKGIGIILVVIGHSIDGHGLMGHYIFSFHMPLFFVLSGLCFNDARYPQFISFLKKRVRTLLLPCLYFTCIILVLSALLMPDYYPLRNLTHKLPNAYWYVFILFLSELFYFLINSATSLKTKVGSLIGCFCISCVLHRQGIILPYNICSVFIATFFYGTGHLIRNTNALTLCLHIPRFVQNENVKGKQKVVLGQVGGGVIILLIIPAISVYVTGKSLDLSGNDIPSPELYYVIIAFIGTAGILTMCHCLSRNGTGKSKQLILFIGKNTLVILMMHMFFIALCCHYIMPLMANKLIYKIVEQIFVWVLLFATVRLVNTKGKWLIGR